MNNFDFYNRLLNSKTLVIVAGYSNNERKRLEPIVGTYISLDILANFYQLMP